jgi:aspartyl-tRNA(Asn)/glutamyl-tRNA(Gln) amidotransferase subunit A
VIEAGLIEAARAVERGEVTSEALTRECLDRLESRGRDLNAVITLDREAALETARARDVERAAGRSRGPLHGVPLAHKDLFYRKGRRSTYGSPIRDSFVPDETATVLSRLDAAGAVDLGTLSLSEFAFSPTGYNRHFGHARNPWNDDHVPGGSSSGSAIAVADRMVFAALGTDTGGSIRHPAAACGVTGLKPTVTRVSRHGAGPLSHSLDCIGPIARSAADCARLVSVIAGRDGRDPTSSTLPVPDHEGALDGSLAGLRIAVPHSYYRDGLDREVERLVDDSIEVLKERGAAIVATATPDMDLVNTLGQVVMAVEAAAIHRPWLRDRREDYAEVVRSRIEPGLFISSTRYVEALSLRRAVLCEFLETAFAGADLVHLPALTVPVPTIAETTGPDGAHASRTLAALTHCTRGINYLGLPAVSIPAGFTSNGLPCAFQLVGRPFAEAMLLRAADAYQRDTQWHRTAPGRRGGRQPT